MKFPVAPAVLGIVLGPMMEVALRQSMILSHGSWMIFLTQPISAVLLIGLVLMLLSGYIRKGVAWMIKGRQR
jgi:putative tricarboxylic transport membrane protein